MESVGAEEGTLGSLDRGGLSTSSIARVSVPAVYVLEKREH